MMSAGILFMASGLRGQSVSPAILRIERVQPGEAVCALVSDDGTYRLEKMFQNKNEMYKGTMELSRLDQLRTLIANQQLSGLSQADIHKPLVTDTADDMQLAVRRRGGWQELVFHIAWEPQTFQASPRSAAALVSGSAKATPVSGTGCRFSNQLHADG